MLVLQETPAGFALFTVNDAKVKQAESQVRDILNIIQACFTWVDLQLVACMFTPSDSHAHLPYFAGYLERFCNA